MAATQLDVISQLAQLLGGSRTTGTADTTALRQVLSQLQQLNSPEGQAAQTQALFQQAAGQIPGLQGAYSNAVGARRGGNSAVQGALNKLLTQTTLAGQAQQNANLQAQAQAAAALANATRGTTTKTNLGGAAGNMLFAADMPLLHSSVKQYQSRGRSHFICSTTLLRNYVSYSNIRFNLFMCVPKLHNFILSTRSEHQTKARVRQQALDRDNADDKALRLMEGERSGRERFKVCGASRK